MRSDSAMAPSHAGPRQFCSDRISRTIERKLFSKRRNECAGSRRSKQVRTFNAKDKSQSAEVFDQQRRPERAVQNKSSNACVFCCCIRYWMPPSVRNTYQARVSSTSTFALFVTRSVGKSK